MKAKLSTQSNPFKQFYFFKYQHSKGEWSVVRPKNKNIQASLYILLLLIVYKDTLNQLQRKQRCSLGYILKATLTYNLHIYSYIMLGYSLKILSLVRIAGQSDKLSFVIAKQTVFNRLISAYPFLIHIDRRKHYCIN